MGVLQPGCSAAALALQNLSRKPECHPVAHWFVDLSDSFSTSNTTGFSFFSGM
jgi:hypothetical protein